MRARLLVCCLFLGLGLSLTTGANASFIFNADLDGSGSYQLYNASAGAYDPIVTTPGTPIAGGFSFVLPESVGLGDVGINDSLGVLQGLIRFPSGGSTTTLTMELFGPGGIPSDAHPNGTFVTLTASGTAHFVAGTGSPDVTNFYNISGFKVVPEPSSVVMLGVGILGILRYRRRRRSVHPVA